jgi:hypothetical protein
MRVNWGENGYDSGVPRAWTGEAIINNKTISYLDLR